MAAAHAVNMKSESSLSVWRCGRYPPWSWIRQLILLRKQQSFGVARRRVGGSRFAAFVSLSIMPGSQDPGTGLLEAFRFLSCESPAALSQGFCFFGDVIRRCLSPERGTLFLRPRGTGVPLFHFWKGEHHATSQVCIGWRNGKADAAESCRSPAQSPGSCSSHGSVRPP
jgi:hypothetical protein